MTFHVPQRKIDKLHSLINTMLSSSEIVVKDLARVAGQIASMTLGLISILGQWIVAGQFFIPGSCEQGLIRPYSTAFYTTDVFSDRKQTALASDDSCRQPSHRRIKILVAARPCTHLTDTLYLALSATSIVYSDASSTGYGGYSVQLGNFHSSAGLWSREESTLSSTCREMKAILNVLKSFKNSLRNHAIIWFTDSANAARIVRHGSSTP